MSTENDDKILLEKRKSESQAIGGLESAARRVKVDEKKMESSSVLIQASSVVLQQQLQSQQAAAADPNRPKKQISAYTYFSLQFREIIRARFSYLSSLQIIKAVSQKWNSLNRDQKQPFEMLANEDK